MVAGLEEKEDGGGMGGVTRKRGPGKGVSEPENQGLDPTPLGRLSLHLTEGAPGCCARPMGPCWVLLLGPGHPQFCG